MAGPKEKPGEIDAPGLHWLPVELFLHRLDSKLLEPSPAIYYIYTIYVNYIYYAIIGSHTIHGSLAGPQLVVGG